MKVEATGLGKSFGSRRAVDNLTFTLTPGRVTGFLGPNGSGKSTTLRLMLGLDHGDGETLFDGKRLTEFDRVTTVVGAHLDAKLFHPQRTARSHLRMLAAEANLPMERVDEVIALMGLTSVANSRPKTFSMGMGQRLGLAGAILGKPEVLLLDEPANGLDPATIHWLRDFLRAYAALGRCVLVSSHLLSEMELMADDIIVIAQGRLVASESMESFIGRSSRNDVVVRTSDNAQLLAVLQSKGFSAAIEDTGVAVTGIDTDTVGHIAFETGLRVFELTARRASLETAFLELTDSAQDYQTSGSLDESQGGAVA